VLDDDCIGVDVEHIRIYENKKKESLRAHIAFFFTCVRLILFVFVVVIVVAIKHKKKYIYK
jgi:type IV secretory pathway component VirB8